MRKTMDILTLHIGHQKTGTTSLQFSLRDSSAALADAGLHYDASFPHHHPMARTFHAPLGHAGDRRVAGRMRAAIKASPLPQALVSSETFCRLTDEEVGACLDSLKPLAGRIQVLCYVRHPLSFASSAAHQRVRMGGRLAGVERNPAIVPFRELLTRWMRAVGEDNLIVRPFDRTLLTNGDVIDDALTMLGAGAAIKRLTRVQSNEALSVLGIHLMDRAIGLSGDKLPTGIALAFDAVAGPKYVLPQQALDRVAERGAAELAFLRETFGLELPEPKPPVPTPPPELSDEELNSIAKVMLDAASYAFDLTHSPAGRLLESPSPFAQFAPKPHPLTPLMKRLGLMDYLRGEAKPRRLSGARAKSP